MSKHKTDCFPKSGLRVAQFLLKYLIVVNFSFFEIGIRNILFIDISDDFLPGLNDHHSHHPLKENQNCPDKHSALFRAHTFTDVQLVAKLYLPICGDIVEYADLDRRLLLLVLAYLNGIDLPPLDLSHIDDFVYVSEAQVGNDELGLAGVV